LVRQLPGQVHRDGRAADGLFFGGGVNGQGKRLELSYSYIETPTLVNVFAGYKINRNWSAQVNVDNLARQAHIVAAAASGLVNTAPTRQIQGTVKYQW